MIRNVVKVSFVAACFSSAGCSDEIDVEPGMWEWSMTMEMPGMPMAIPPTVDSSCTTREDLIPKAAGENKDCNMLENKVTGNSVQWKMECNIAGGKSTSEGKMTYSGTTANGEITASTQGMVMTTKVNGRRTGDCK